MLTRTLRRAAPLPAPLPHALGFTLIELVVTLAIAAILIVVALPGLSTWMRNARLRTSAELIQNGLRTAQAEALKQGRQTAFALTASQVLPAQFNANAPPAAVANGAYWYAVSVPFLQNHVDAATNVPEQFVLLAAGEAGSSMQGVAVTGPKTVCFSSYGRVTPTSNSALVACSAFGPADTVYPGAPGFTYQVRMATAEATDVALNVTIAGNGQVRLCNFNHSANTAPDGC